MSQQCHTQAISKETTILAHAQYQSLRGTRFVISPIREKTNKQKNIRAYTVAKQFAEYTDTLICWNSIRTSLASLVLLVVAAVVVAVSAAVGGP